jgi:hypothetical protein
MNDSLMKRIVMNFLVIEGYQQVAQQFEKEAHIQRKTNTNSQHQNNVNNMNRQINMYEICMNMFVFVLFVASVPLSSISSRMSIRGCIISGDIPGAINLINDLNPLILENESLLLSLLQQQLIELIKTNEFEKVLEFARTEIAPRTCNEPEQLKQMEAIMCLLAFREPPNSISSLLSNKQRQQLANKLNEAILEIQCQQTGKQIYQHIG